jgi:hypothetical protein
MAPSRFLALHRCYLLLLSRWSVETSLSSSAESSAVTEVSDHVASPHHQQQLLSVTSSFTAPPAGFSSLTDHPPFVLCLACGAQCLPDNITLQQHNRDAHRQKYHYNHSHTGNDYRSTSAVPGAVEQTEGKRDAGGEEAEEGEEEREEREADRQGRERRSPVPALQTAAKLCFSISSSQGREDTAASSTTTKKAEGGR